MARWPTTAVTTRRARLPRAAAACAAGAAALLMLTKGMNLRFHIENTSEAMADEAHGTLWLLGSAVLFAGAASLALWSRAPRWSAGLIGLPLIAGILPALLLPGNIIPFGTALLSGLVAVVGLTATVLSAARQ